jgi:hypothetical protein
MKFTDLSPGDQFILNVPHQANHDSVGTTSLYLKLEVHFFDGASIYNAVRIADGSLTQVPHATDVTKLT